MVDGVVGPLMATTWLCLVSERDLDLLVAEFWRKGGIKALGATASTCAPCLAETSRERTWRRATKACADSQPEENKRGAGDTPDVKRLHITRPKQWKTL